MEINKKYILDNKTIDEISEETEKFLNDIKMEGKNLLRIRLLVEDLLLEWQEKFGREAECQIKMGKRFGRPYIQMELNGDTFNPLDKNIEDYGYYRNNLLANMGLAPIYSYERGINKIAFKLKKQKSNPLYSLAVAVVFGITVGMAGMLLPDALRAGVLDNVLTPVYDTFFNLSVNYIQSLCL